MADFEVVERVWLSAVFSEEVARSLPKDSPELERMLFGIGLSKETFTRFARLKAPRTWRMPLRWLSQETQK